MRLEFFWDVASPYTYLAHTQMAGLAERTGAEIVYRPMLLGGVFKAIDSRMPAATPGKGPYMMRDLARWRERYGVPLRLPVQELAFPINSVRPMRVATVLDQRGRGVRAADALMRTYWAEGEDVSRPEVLDLVVAGVGESPAEISAAAESDEIKAALRSNTEEAVRRGAFGAPTFFVEDEMFWGNDRLSFVEAALRRG